MCFEFFKDQIEDFMATFGPLAIVLAALEISLQGSSLKCHSKNCKHIQLSSHKRILLTPLNDYDSTSTQVFLSFFSLSFPRICTSVHV